MKLKTLLMLCLLLLVFYIPFSLAKGGSKGGSKSGGGYKSGGGWFGSSSKTSHSSNKGHAKSDTKKSQSKSQSTAHKQSGKNQHGTMVGYPQSAVAVRGRYSSPGGYPGGYINQNPNNVIMSPHYAGSFGYGGYQTWGGSPFSHRITKMGLYPNYRSQGFGHSAARAAAAGTMTRMALGYGLGRFPRPHFHFQDSQQEYHYNQYMYKKYGSRSTNTNDYSRDYIYSPSSQAQTYEDYMKSCMTRSDLLTTKSEKPQSKPTKTNATAAVPSVSKSEMVRNTTKGDNVKTETSKTSVLPPLNQSKTDSTPKATLVDSSVEDNDTVSIVEIGYPALIEQMKARRCLELYLDESERYMKRVYGRVRALKIEFQGLLAVVISTILMLHNSNMLLN